MPIHWEDSSDELCNDRPNLVRCILETIVPDALKPMDRSLREHCSRPGNDGLSLRDWILIKLDMSNALRPSELFPLGKSKGHVKDIQGIMRHTKASTTTDVYMQSLEPEVRNAINSIYDELMGNGTDGPVPDAPCTASASSRSESEHLVAAAAQESSERTHSATVEHAEASEAKPARGVVLEFATRMRQSRGREVLLND